MAKKQPIKETPTAMEAEETTMQPGTQTDNCGILLIALGHPYYGRMAFNLAVSLKNQEPSLKIALLYSPSAVTHLRPYEDRLPEYFDSMIECPTHVYGGGKGDYLRAKVFMNELTPFDRTIFLDADMIALKGAKMAHFFDELKHVGFTMANYGCELVKDVNLKGGDKWGNPEQIINGYEINAMAQWYRANSVFVYWQKDSVDARAVFETAQAIYDSPNCEHIEFAGSVPDELAFEIAMMQTDVYPHEQMFTPAFWPPFYAEQKELRDLTEFNFFSAAGNRADEEMKRNYNALAKYHFNIAGLQYPYLLKPKASFIPARHTY